ncbi:MAG: HupE/UreJ family protein [Burkholderiales bacterium]
MNTALRLMAPAAAVLLAPSLAFAHHAMDNAMPTTLLQGLLSGLGHPVIGLDHLAFIIAAGVLAARYSKGLLLALLFVLGSIAGAVLHLGGLDLPGVEWWIAATLLVVAVPLLRRGPAFVPAITVFYAIAGYAHGYALAETIVGAEATPLAGYFAGLTAIQALLATAAYGLTRWVIARRPGVPLARATGVAAAVAAVAVIALNLGSAGW